MIKAVVDIETDAIDASVIHCIVAMNYSTGAERVWVGEECQKFGEWARQVDTFIMHNGVSFDAPILNRLAGAAIRPAQITDTLIQSQLFNPVREGGHSLEAWGKRLKFLKGEYNDFTMFNETMLQYCKRDAELTRRVAVSLEKENRKLPFSRRSYELEINVRTVLDQQQKNGFAFNIRDAMILLARLEDEQHALERKAEEMFEPTEVKLKTKTNYIPFNIASRKQIAERLKREGWKPTHKTKKGNVIISEEILNELDMKEARMFSRYFLLQKRTGLIKSWIQQCEEDERVRGRVLTLKTITGRMAHHSPNMAQVPASYSPYGKECRELWTVSNPGTHVLMGTDASSLELRCLAHYMEDENFTREVLTGDVHTANQKAAGLDTRDQAKTFIYAFLYGAGPFRIGKVVGGGYKKGEELIAEFLDNMPKLKSLRDKVIEEGKTKTIKGLDGRMLHIRSPHASLNTLLQGAGAIICKHWLVHMIRHINREGIDARLVASIHDEYQFEVAKKDMRKLGEITRKAIHQTTETLGMKCPLDCDYKTGTTWLETH